MSKENEENGFNKLRDQVKKKKDKSSKKKDNGKINSNNNGKNDGNVNGNGDIDVNIDGDVNIDILKSKEDQKVKRTYYIKQDHDKRLNELSRKSGRDKSELIRMAIDFLYENANLK
ncbi:MAG: CopG family transcriptional regulator [Halanaerobium sp.]